ncbi:YihY/virulence factor BrkB family protein [Salinigranum sp. GCM10025319]|uniref:YihY/virulence factor BrkB family protein n=1 Tax=Salinigranum sp. GCM10025319 TaxID=3252687 RepID=UPI00360B8EA3
MENPKRPDLAGEDGLLSTVRCIIAALRENFALLVAGSLAYSAFMSILPLLTLAFVVASVVGGQQFVDAALQFVGQYTPPSVQELFVRAMQQQTGRIAVSIVSVLLLLWSALRVFRTLDTSFSMFYNTTEAETVVGRTVDALLVVVLLGGALVATLGMGIAASVLSNLPLDRWLTPLLLVFPLVLAFLPIYYVFPDTDVSIREVMPGVVVAAVGWALLQGGFQLYVRYGGQSEVYGVLGVVLVVLTWLYLAGLVLLVGVAVNVVLGDRTQAALAPPPSRTDVARYIRR